MNLDINVGYQPDGWLDVVDMLGNVSKVHIDTIVDEGKDNVYPKTIDGLIQVIGEVTKRITCDTAQLAQHRASLHQIHHYLRAARMARATNHDTPRVIVGAYRVVMTLYKNNKSSTMSTEALQLIHATLCDLADDYFQFLIRAEKRNFVIKK